MSYHLEHKGYLHTGKSLPNGIHYIHKCLTHTKKKMYISFLTQAKFLESKRSREDNVRIKNAEIKPSQDLAAIFFPEVKSNDSLDSLLWASRSQ